MVVSNGFFLLLLASGCYDFRAAKEQIRRQEAEVGRLQGEIQKEAARRNALENDPLIK